MIMEQQKEKTAPEETLSFTSLDRYKKMERELLAPVQSIGTAGKIWIGFLVTICLIGVYAYYCQARVIFCTRGEVGKEESMQ